MKPYELLKIAPMNIVFEHKNELEEIYEEYKKEYPNNHILWLCQMMFHYGYIIGLREERKKRKSH